MAELGIPKLPMNIIERLRSKQEKAKPVAKEPTIAQTPSADLGIPKLPPDIADRLRSKAANTKTSAPDTKKPDIIVTSKGDALGIPKMPAFDDIISRLKDDKKKSIENLEEAAENIKDKPLEEADTIEALIKASKENVAHNKRYNKALDQLTDKLHDIYKDGKTAKSRATSDSLISQAFSGVIGKVLGVGALMSLGYGAIAGILGAERNVDSNELISDEAKGVATTASMFGGTLAHTLAAIPDNILRLMGKEATVGDSLTPLLSQYFVGLAGKMEGGGFSGLNNLSNIFQTSSGRYGPIGDRRSRASSVNKEDDELVQAIDDLIDAVERQTGEVLNVARPRSTAPRAMPATSIVNQAPTPTIQRPVQQISLPQAALSRVSAPTGSNKLYESGGVIDPKLRDRAWRGDREAIRQLYTEYGPGIIALLSESGGRGAGEVSRGNEWGDRGGISFGIPQFTSVFMGSNGSTRPGSVFSFLNSNEAREFKPQFEELAKKLNIPYGSVALSTNPQFSELWRKLAAEQTAAFTKAQLDFSTKEYENPQTERLRRQGIDLQLDKRPILRELTKGLSQFGRHGDTAIIAAFAGKDLENMTEAQMIEELTKARLATVDRVFSGSNANIRASHKQRAEREAAQARALLGLSLPTPTTQTAQTQTPMSTIAENNVQSRPGFIVPTSGPITSPFGPRIHPITKQPRMHQGVDIGAPSGRPVVAAAGGSVTFAGMQQGYGNIVILKHDDGASTRYAHLSAFDVRQGEKVSQGQLIGKVGSTGLSSGPHLHYEQRDAQGNAVMPIFAATAASVPSNIPTATNVNNTVEPPERQTLVGAAEIMRQPVQTQEAAPTRTPPLIQNIVHTKANFGNPSANMRV